jgi:hypothetical protein
MQVHCPLSQELQRFKRRCKNGNASAPVRPSAEAVTGRNTPVARIRNTAATRQNNENCEDIMQVYIILNITEFGLTEKVLKNPEEPL